MIKCSKCKKMAEFYLPDENDKPKLYFCENHGIDYLKNRGGVALLPRIKKLVKGGLNVVMIAGNHDLPKTESRVCPMEVYSEIGIDSLHYLSQLDKILLSLNSYF
jgi:DNA repair exonuclease SbcCD nuclease subunit